MDQWLYILRPSSYSERKSAGSSSVTVAGAVLVFHQLPSAGQSRA